ncbi:MAG: hypothetical protein U9R03_04495 [Candidatus Aerophobetes bacterium]|nr:hypothetical protein [Candidatus Aerophobetes bacterium]
MAVNFKKIHADNIVEGVDKLLMTSAERTKLGLSLIEGNNLSELTNKATARDNLDLGTVAVKNIGINADNIPILDENGKLLTEIMPESALSSKVDSVNGRLGRVIIRPSDLHGTLVSNDEFEYLSGVTTSIQEQLNKKIISVNGKDNNAIIIRPSDLHGTLVSNDEFEYLSGVTTSIQEQLNGKIDSINGKEGEVIFSPSDLHGTLVSNDEFEYLSGVTTSIQEQLNSKINNAQISTSSNFELVYDSMIPSQKAVKNYVDNNLQNLSDNINGQLSNKLETNKLDTDETFTDANDSMIPSQKAVKNYVDNNLQNLSLFYENIISGEIIVDNNLIILPQGALFIISIYILNEGKLLNGFEHECNSNEIILDTNDLNNKTAYINYAIGEIN